MAYSPIEQGRLAHEKRLASVASQSGLSAAQVALAWLFSSDDIIVIPKTSSPSRLRDNLRALNDELTSSQLAELNRLFPPPSRRRPLEMI